MLKLKIDARREYMCYTRASLSRKTGIPYNTILKLCRGELVRIQLSDLDILCEVLECDLKDLIEREQNRLCE